MKNGLKPIPRTYLFIFKWKTRDKNILIIARYFALPSSNPNEQFYYFTMLIAWLVRLCGHHFTPPGQFDDPNATSATLGTFLPSPLLSPHFSLFFPQPLFNLNLSS
jgi:hypothetical protein